MKVAVGLGNPGKEFENTRHNTGFMVVEKIIKNLELRVKSASWRIKFRMNKKFKAEVLKLDAKRYSLGTDLLLVKPQTFMNTSGEAVLRVLKYYKINKLDNLFLIFDDLDIELGKYKIQFGKGPRKHNGVLSVEKQLASKDFWHIRIGIAQPENKKKEGIVTGKNYVLGKFRIEERELLDGTIKTVVREIKEKLYSLCENP